MQEGYDEHMHKSRWIVVGVIILVAGGWYALTAYTVPKTASITISSPKSGDAWERGSTHVVAWKTAGVNANDKISVTIRRIPPPPLQAEGQEFDPILFTDLPNTGSVEWTVSDQYPDGTYVLGLTAYESLPVTNPVFAESPEFAITPRPLAQDIYPLYDKVEWQSPKGETFVISTTTYAGTSISSVPVENTMTPAAIFSPFERYYANLLATRGWKIENALAAGGHVGGQTAYRKGDELILVRFSVLYHTVSETASSECPCDVTVSLFSSK